MIARTNINANETPAPCNLIWKLALNCIEMSKSGKKRNRESNFWIPFNAGGWFQLKVAYDSSVIRSPETHPRPHIRQANRVAAPAIGEIKGFLPRMTRTAKSARDAGPRAQAPCDFYLPSLLPRSARPSSSLVFITRVTNDSISIHFCSDWSMIETIVSGVSCAFMETRYKETNLLWPYFTKHKMMFCQVLS